MMDRDTKLIATLRRQYHIILTAISEIYSVLGGVARIAVLKSQLVHIIDVLHNTYVIVQIEKLSDYEQLFLICFLPTMQANIFSR